MSEQSTAALCPSPYVKNLAGKTFGRLTVQSFVGVRGTGHQHAFWLCLCECGRREELRGSSLAGRGQCTHCARKQAHRKTGLANRLPGHDAAVNALISEYVQNAKAKGVPYCLDRETARNLFESDCWYCGAAPIPSTRRRRRHTDYPHNGIDRLDSTAGYVASNVVACCAVCNYAKRQMTPAEFLAWACRVCDHHRGQGSP